MADVTRFLHSADLHLDSPLQGLAAYPGAPVQTIRGATRRALESLVELAIAEAVDLVIVAGDVYDGDWRDFSTGLFFRAQTSRLTEAGIAVVLIKGNHDAASVVSRQLDLPHVHVLSHRAPETVVLEDLGLAVHGQSFATRAVTENLAATYPPPLPGLVNIGVLHTSLAGAPGHDTYAPAELSQLVAHGYDYWALGHIHERAVLSEDPWVVYAGNPQGRHINEAGPRGVTLVEVGEDGLTLSERTLDHVRWERVRVDVGGVADATELLERAGAALAATLAGCEGRLLAARLELEGMTSAHAALLRDRDGLEVELRAGATDLGFEQIWIERILWHITPLRSAPAADDTLGAALDILGRAGEDPGVIAELSERLAPLARKLPSALRHGPEGLDPGDETTIRAALAEAREMLPGYLLEQVA